MSPVSAYPPGSSPDYVTIFFDLLADYSLDVVLEIPWGFQGKDTQETPLRIGPYRVDKPLLYDGTRVTLQDYVAIYILIIPFR